LDPYKGHIVNLPYFKNQGGGGSHLEKSQKLRYHSIGLADLCEVWHDYAKWDSKPSRLLKNLNFQNPRWRTAAILKTVKSPYIRNRLTDFDEIWHADADWPYTGD